MEVCSCLVFFLKVPSFYTIINIVISEMEEANTRLEGAFDEEVGAITDKQYFMTQLGDDYVNDSVEGRNFKKENQAGAYEQLYDK